MNRPTVNCQPSTVKFSLRKFLYFFFAFIIFNTANSQTVSATLDRDKILLGEQVTLQFTLTGLDEGTATVAAWPQLNDTINHTEIIKRSPVDTINVNYTYSYQQNFTLTSFDSGRWQLGPFTFVLKDRFSGKQTQLTTPPLYLVVLPVDVSAMKNYHPIKDIIEVDAGFNWMPVIIAAIILAAVLIILIIIRSRKRKPVQAPKEVVQGTPLERAVEKLNALQKASLTSNDDIKKFHTAVDDITRKYFEDMMQVKALQLTISELFSRINVYLQDVELRKKFRNIFEVNASVKFAKYLPLNNESKNTLNEIIKNLYEVDDSINRSRTNANRMVQKY